MVGLTLAISILGSIATLALRPIYGLGVFMAVVFCYSQRLMAPVGTIDFTTGRIVILSLLLSAFIRGHHKTLKFSWLDFFALATWGLQTLALFKNVAPNILIERQGGVFFDTIFVYFAVRMIVRDKKDLITLIKMIAIIATPLAMMGLYQSITGRNILAFMERAASGDPHGEYQIRMGMHRATVSMSVHIVLGLFFALCFPTVLGLLKQKAWPPLTVLIFSGFMAMGIMSSMSSSPLFAFVIAMGILCYYPFRKTWPVALTAFIMLIIFVEVFSNRHFYEVMTRFSFDSATAYYRVALIKECFGGGMDGHWWLGYGYVGIGPGNDNTNFHWEHLDMVNLYIGYLVRYGLVGMIPFLFFNFTYYKKLINAITLAKNDGDRWMAWSIMAALGGVNVAMMTVSAMEAARTMMFILIAVTNNLPLMVTEENMKRVRGGVRRPRRRPIPGGGRVPMPMPPGGMSPGMATMPGRPPMGMHPPHPGMRPHPGMGSRMPMNPPRPPQPIRQPKLRPMRPNQEGETTNG